MQAFLGGCLLSSSVMLGVATEHSFLKLLETIEVNPASLEIYQNAFNQRTILQKFNKFKNILEQNAATLPANIKEDLDTNLGGILSMIRTFRNESGHPSGKIITREQAYVLLQLFIPCCKKIYELIEYFRYKQE
jgi:transcriptional regulator of heat shock response